MKNIIHKPVGVVWLILIIGTVFSWAIGLDTAAVQAGESSRPSSIAIILITFFKARMVIIYFMDVKYSLTPLRIAAEVWVTTVCTSVIFAYIFGEELAALRILY